MIPSAAPYSMIWTTERQVITESPLMRAFCCLGECPRE